jgi:hypothetical protein
MAAGSAHGRFARQPSWGRRRLAITKKVTMPSGKVKTFILHATRGWKAA